MNHVPAERAARKYRDRLAALAGLKGRRNAELLGLVTLGVMAGLSDDRILAEVRGASGNPPLTDAEIRHALAHAHLDTVPLTDRQDMTRTWRPTPPKPPPLRAGARSYVQRMIDKGRGATFEALAASSPVPIPPDTMTQTRAFLRNLYADNEMLFFGDRTDAGRIGQNIRTADEWQCVIDTDPPPLLIANPLTGREGLTKEGTPSFRCGACVSACRFALVEFDAMPLPEQCAFWSGVIESGTLPLRSLVFSGGKSIHGLVEIRAQNVSTWAQRMECLMYAVCHPDAPDKFKADRACKNTDRLTRLAGALRPDKGTRQTLLWLSPGTPPVSPTIAPPPTHATTRPKPPPSPCVITGKNGAARCRDCWNWTPDGFGHGCAAGIRERPSPDWHGPCAFFDAVV